MKPTPLTIDSIPTLKEFESLIQMQAKLIEAGGVDELIAASVAFQNAGIYADCHVGMGEHMKGTDEESVRLRLEWFAGGLVDLEQKEAHYGVNTWLNLASKQGSIRGE